MAPLLEVKELRLSLPGEGSEASILRDLSFSLGPGESLGVVGESGCGKSMTALSLMGLLPERARLNGSIRLDGQELVGLGERDYCQLRGAKMAMIFQEPMTALNPVHSIGRQIAETLQLHLSQTRAEAADETERLLERVGMPTSRFSPRLFPHQLSGGQRQRVMIAMAIACRPALLICDEPTTALDVTVQAQILDLLAGIVAEEGLALLLITHDLGVVAEMTDRMIVMYAGQIAESGGTAEVFGRLAHPYSRGLFAAMPRGELIDPGETYRLSTIPGRVPTPENLPMGCVFAPRCPRAQDDCRRSEPRLEQLSSGHGVRCLHPHREGWQV